MRKKYHKLSGTFLVANVVPVRDLFIRYAIRVLIMCCIASAECKAQSKLGIENYNYWGQSNTNIIVPMIHIETKKNWYAEVRYNYEEVQTLSLFAGKTFTGGSSLQYSITPMAGASAGNFTGLSFATNTEMEWKNLYTSSQTQYSIGTRAGISNFFFSWSELGYNITDHLFGGLAFQYTRQQGMSKTEPGFLAGLNFKGISIPFYVFSPFNGSRYFILGLNYEYNFKKQR